MSTPAEQKSSHSGDLKYALKVIVFHPKAQGFKWVPTGRLPLRLALYPLIYDEGHRYCKHVNRHVAWLPSRPLRLLPTPQCAISPLLSDLPSECLTTTLGVMISTTAATSGPTYRSQRTPRLTAYCIAAIARHVSGGPHCAVSLLKLTSLQVIKERSRSRSETPCLSCTRNRMLHTYKPLSHHAFYMHQLAILLVSPLGIARTDIYTIYSALSRRSV